MFSTRLPTQVAKVRFLGEFPNHSSGGGVLPHRQTLRMYAKSVRTESKTHALPVMRVDSRVGITHIIASETQ
jgi:hypothetical protein